MQHDRPDPTGRGEEPSDRLTVVSVYLSAAEMSLTVPYWDSQASGAAAPGGHHDVEQMTRQQMEFRIG